MSYYPGKCPSSISRRQAWADIRFLSNVRIFAIIRNIHLCDFSPDCNLMYCSVISQFRGKLQQTSCVLIYHSIKFSKSVI